MAPTDPSLYCPDCGGRLSTEAWGEDLCLACLLLLAAPTSNSEAVSATEAPTQLAEISPASPDDYEATVAPAGSDEYEATVATSSGGYKATAAPRRSRATEVAAEFSFSKGQMLGDRYRVLKRLGRGGMGEVWRAYDLKLRMDVALKTLLMTMGGGEEALEILRGEVRAAREVISPNVCRLFDIIEIDGQELVSMEYIDGQTLMDLLDERCPLEIQEAGEIGSQFLAGLEAIHQAGLVHRDIKPENIMLTRSGRVVIMDFGLTAPSGTGELSGTPAYMPPEQGRGEATDARADVFSAGMVLSEMLSAERGPEASSRQAFWENVRKEPPVLPESPWSRTLVKAVAADPEDRYDSAAQLARKLEEIAVRVEGAEDKKPYPGLESFSEESAEFFFGREAEVEALWKKLQQSSLLGLIGASGAGKSSFVNAGLLPAKPEGWAHLKIKPGPAPFAALGRGLWSVLGEEHALADSGAPEDSEATLAAIRSWRALHPQVLLIVDQFEELFTQNPLEVQESFTDLLRRVALEEDVHVLLSMRDDFLIQCQRFDALAPVFSELTPLGPPIGTALRRALIQPARKCGYRFEDDSMVEEMLEEVTKERGALPLIAFTTARLWEERDQDSGLLTREAYDRMGGVEGALAQHAEATLESIGKARRRIVRELFRNLVTAQGTRAVMEVDEVLSVFTEDREAAAEVVQSLIDARLLTTYEVRSAEGEEPQRRVEIVHESLLSAWPRLVRWRTQDAEGAQLRDELRQAAKLWEARNRSVDLLWTGTAFREFELWRERYSGRLTAVEENFAAAMTAFETRRAKRRRIALATASVVLLAVLAVVTTLWRQSVQQTRNAEAQKLLALGQVEFAEYPSASLAWARASLEVMDTRAGRLFAQQALSQGPVGRVVQPPNDEGVFHRVSFSRNGEWASFMGYTNLSVQHRSGGERAAIFEFPSSGTSGIFAFHDGSSRLLRAVKAYWDRDVQELRTYSLPELEELSRVEAPIGDFRPWTLAPNGMHLYRQVEEGAYELFRWEAPDPPKSIGTVVADDCADEPTGEWWLCWRGQDLVLYSAGDLASEPRFVRTIEGTVGRGLLDPNLDWLAVQDPETHVITGWSLRDDTSGPLWALETQGFRRLVLDPTGTRLAEADPVDGTATAFIWDLRNPSADPVKLTRPDMRYLNGLAFDPSGRWLVMTTVNGATFWPLPERLAEVYSGGDIMLRVVGFTPDQKSLIIADGWNPARRIVRLQPVVEGGVELEMRSEIYGLSQIQVDPEGRFLVAGGDGVALIQPLDGSEPTRLEGFSRAASLKSVGYDAERQLVAAAPNIAPPDQKVIRVWSLRDGSVQVLSADDAGEGFVGGYAYLQFLPDGDLLSCGYAGVLRWNLEDGSYEKLAGPCGSDVGGLVVTPDGGVAVASVRGRVVAIDLDSGEVRELEGFEPAVQVVALGPKGEYVATGTRDGKMQIGKLSGGEPHFLFGHPFVPRSLTFSPDGRQLISTHEGGTLRVWDLPDLAATPFQLLPYEEMMARLAGITNLQVVPDAEATTGYKLELGSFMGWETVPKW